MPHPFLDKNVSWGPPPGEGEAYDVCCPVCGYNYVGFSSPEMICAREDYGAKWKDRGAKWGGKGDLIVIHFNCENGCSWDLCVGFHKGNSLMFVSNLRADDGQEYGQPDYDYDPGDPGPQPDYDT